MPTLDDFAIEIFGGEALIVRLADMCLFRVNRQALTLFEMLLESDCDTAAAAKTAERDEMDLDPGDFESIRKILFAPENDQAGLQL